VRFFTTIAYLVAAILGIGAFFGSVNLGALLGTGIAWLVFGRGEGLLFIVNNCVAAAATWMAHS
jgi:hypothetical protein